MYRVVSLCCANTFLPSLVKIESFLYNKKRRYYVVVLMSSKLFERKLMTGVYLYVKRGWNEFIGENMMNSRFFRVWMDFEGNFVL